MQIVQALADVNVLDVNGHLIYDLQCNEPYVLYNHEADRALACQAAARVQALDDVLPVYRGESLTDERLLLPFIGRLGDTMALASCLTALTDHYPDVCVDVASPASSRQVLALVAPFGNLLHYPVRQSQLGAYAYYMSFEHIDAVVDGAAHGLAETFSRCLHTPVPTRRPDVLLPVEATQKWHLSPTTMPRVALHAGAPDGLRTIPPAMLQALCEVLVEESFKVYLIGTHQELQARTDEHFWPDSVADLIGKTTTAADLAALLGQMSFLITSDGFPMHLAGTMELPTLALFTSTDAALASDYPTIKAMVSGSECSPCHVAIGRCPLGHDRCVAFEDDVFDVNAMVEIVKAHCLQPVPV